LVGSLLANYFLPWDRLPSSVRTVGFLLSAAYGVSVFLAGVIFTEVYARTARKSDAFGANILGAVAGLTQNASFILGMKALLLIAAVFYGIAAVAGKFNPMFRKAVA